MANRVVALDADNVLLDYSTAYAGAWERAFGERPVERDPTAYWPIDRWRVERLKGPRLQRFRDCFDHAFWSTMPAVAGALEACRSLRDAGYALVCVTALDVRYEAARVANLRELGFPIERVVATGSSAIGNPKAAVLAELKPKAFVDDDLPYLVGLVPGIHAALITRQSTGSPNVSAGMDAVHSQHADLLAFSRWWLNSR